MAGMFDINGGEWFIILLVALIVVGPRKMPELARKAGTWLRSIRAMATDFRVGLEREIAELEEPLKSVRGDLEQPLRSVTDELKAVGGELRDAGKSVTGPLEWTGPVAGAGPSPTDAAADLERINAGEDLHGAGPDTPLVATEELDEAIPDDPSEAAGPTPDATAEESEEST